MALLAQVPDAEPAGGGGPWGWVVLHRPQVVAAALVVAAFLVVGFRDLLRLNGRRLWALSSVVWRESVRRRVLWVTPLAIVGVIAASQFSRPLDVQDEVRQTLKYCMFITGLLMTLTVIVLACTSLPKDIETRVIYTVVTKPPTRLEIVLGKVLGFVRVSLAILLMMGLFTWAYVNLQASRLRSAAGAQVEHLSPSDPARATLEHYRDFGLLHAKTYARADDLQFHSRYPRPPAGGQARGEPDARGTDAGPLRWMFGNREGDILVPFDLPPALFPEGISEEELATNQLYIFVASIGVDPAGRFTVRRHPMAHVGVGREETWARLDDANPPPPVPPATNPAPSTQPGAELTPLGVVTLLSEDRYNLVSDVKDKATMIEHGVFVLPRPVEWNGPPRTRIVVPATVVERLRPQPPIKDDGRPENAGKAGFRRMYVRLEAPTPGYEYGAGDTPVRLFSPRLGQWFDPARLDPDFPPAIFRGPIGTRGRQTLRGGDPAQYAVPVAVYAYRHRPVDAGRDGVPLELSVTVERSGGEAAVDREDPTVLSLQVFNLASGTFSRPQELRVEASRRAFVNLPADAVKGGDFDLLVRCHTTGHVVGLLPQSVLLVTAEQGFAWNLLKGLAVLWLMSLLVVIIAVFCSTFVSWPIAVVLTVVMLLGRWGVVQLGDAAKPGVGANVAADLFRNSDAATHRVVSESVEMLTKVLNGFASVLPDISVFSASEYIERGWTVNADVLRGSLAVSLGFGLPLVMLAYLFLWRKEVAP